MTNVTKIELFGEKLLYSERLMKDFRILNEATKSVNGELKPLIAKIEAIKDGLKINFEKASFFRKLKLKWMFRTKNFIKKAELSRIEELFLILATELEKFNFSKTAKSKSVDISETYQDLLVANATGLNINEVNELSVNTYKEALEFSINWGNFLRGGKFEFLSASDKQAKFEQEYKEMFESDEVVNG